MLLLGKNQKNLEAPGGLPAHGTRPASPVHPRVAVTNTRPTQAEPPLESRDTLLLEYFKNL